MSVPNTRPEGGAHRAENRMIVRFPADITPGYFISAQARLKVTVPVVQPGLIEGANDWLVVGPREGLVDFANTVASLSGR